MLFFFHCSFNFYSFFDAFAILFLQADMFLDKNRDNMRMEMVELFSTSKSPVSDSSKIDFLLRYLL